MQKKLVQSSLALTAAAALGLGSAFVASPALADGPQTLDVQNEKQVQKALNSVGGVNAYGVRGNELNIGVAKPESDGAQAFADKYENVNILEAAEDIKPHAKNDVVGGTGYLSDIPSAPGYVGACSTGIAGWDASGKQIILTAGHCAEDIDKESNVTTGKVVLKDTEKPSSAPANGGERGYEPKGIGPLGDWGYTKFGSDVLEVPTPGEEPNWPEPKSDDIDFAVINVDESKYNVKNGIADWSKESADADDLSTSVSAIKDVGAHTEGTVEKSGRTTGLTEGDVFGEYNEQFDFQSVGGRWVHGFAVLSEQTDPFSQPGDSGGGVFQGDTAVGVISGGGPYDGQQLGWVADLDYSLETAGIDFQVTKPDDGGGDDADADAGADAKDADADAGADAKDADADAGADAKDADADAGADAKDADADAGADAKDADADAGADAKDANADADGSDTPEAPKVGDQTVEEGGQITGKTEANAKVKLDWKPASGTHKTAPEGSVTVTADAEGNFTTEAPSEAGEYAYTATATTDAGTSKATSFTVTVEAAADEAEADTDGATAAADAGAEADAAADGAEADAGAAADAKNAESNADSDGSKDGEAPAERKISIEPKEIAASDFVKKDKGVQIKVQGFEEGENVSLEVVAGPENVEGITLDETANENGVAAFSIYGTNASDPSAYLGKYDVQVTGANDTDDEKALSGSFTVVADEDGNGGGSDDGDGGDGGSDLPRTGAELTGLAAGAGLLVVGGAAVVLTMRRNKKN
ncbi:LPXTG cell wall anchor domain-containing protein [Brevibacterium aurantiacum]|uniref:LPXTG-motif cell wall anchor domain-containing protein n=1 Tax=Brevibacterium aurantiacum TaxID=273384 RepID=A0A2H1JG32_BREAU|nr:LPXTG cell wall anchor domain-containing protein [Brevibacterium aurantiacum]SMX86268.1 LPXTG-motif cell wall anchor domain-containing protein [Brevibacterium aurantiacum]